MPSVRSVALGVWVGVGSRDEHPAEAGCSHILEHLLFKGTTRRSALDIAETIDAVGGEMNAFTSKELTCFYVRVLDRDLPVAFEVLADMIVDARNAPEDVEAERQVVLSELDIHVDSPDELVLADAAEALLGTHPLAREPLGTVDSVAGMDRDTIDDYYRTNYRPQLLTVAAAGNVDHDRVVTLVDQLLGDLGRPGGRRIPRAAPEQYLGGQVLVRHRPTEQVHVAMVCPGLTIAHEQRWPARVLDTLLGGGMSSRLFQEIRERRGLAYTTFSFEASYTDAGMFGAYVGTSPGKLDEVLGVLREELDRVARDVTAGEVERAKNALRGGTVLGLEDTGSRMSRLGSQVTNGMEIVTVDEALERVAAVGLGDVRAVAASLLAAPRSLAIVGPYDPQEAERFRSVVA